MPQATQNLKDYHQQLIGNWVTPFNEPYHIEARRGKKIKVSFCIFTLLIIVFLFIINPSKGMVVVTFF
jgi:hypothetical protein